MEIVNFNALLGSRMTTKNYPYRVKPVEYSMLSYSDKFRETRDKLINFMEEHVFGNEMTYFD